MPILARGDNRGGGEARPSAWAWDSVPVRPMRAALHMPSWWDALNSDFLTTESHETYATEMDTRDADAAMVHVCALRYHDRRLQNKRDAVRRARGAMETESNGILTPCFAGRTPSAQFLVSQYIEASEARRRKVFR